MTAKITTAMVLAAGMGTRMQPLTDTLPKPLVALGGVALIDRVLDRLAAVGVTRAVVNVHHLADLMERHLLLRQAPEIVISDERGVLLDTGGAVMRAAAQLGPGPFFVHNSDSVWIERGIENLRRMEDAWDPNRMQVLMLLAARDRCLGYDGRGDFAMDDAGRLTRRAKDGDAPYVFAGVSIADQRLLTGAPDGNFSLNVLWDRALAAGDVSGIVLDGDWMHIGTPAALAEAESELRATTSRADDGLA